MYKKYKNKTFKTLPVILLLNKIDHKWKWLETHPVNITQTKTAIFQVAKLLCILCNKLHHGYREGKEKSKKCVFTKVSKLVYKTDAHIPKKQTKEKKSSGMILMEEKVNIGSTMLK